MINRLRVILPPDSVVIGVVLIFAIAEIPYIILEWKIKQPLDVTRISLAILRFIAVGYGFWRLNAFHPAYLPDYRAWLERSPWNYKSPLPAGPISLVWEDLLPLSGLMIMAAFFGSNTPYSILSLFLGAYLTSLVIITGSTGIRWFGYAIVFGIGLAIRLSPDPKVALGVLVVTYVVAMIGLRVSLAKFPWPAFQEADMKAIMMKIQENACGWPFDQLSPQVKSSRSSSKLDGLMIGLLAGWLLFACESLMTAKADQIVVVQLVFTGAIGMLAGVRLLIYCAGHAPPISLWGRIRTFRLIIPGYDKIFLAPLCVILVGVLALDRFRPPGLDDLVVLPIAVAAAITVALDTGPSIRSWRLTGHHRITAAGSKMNGEFVKVG